MPPQSFELSIQGWGLNFYIQLDRPLCFLLLLVCVAFLFWKKKDGPSCEVLPHHLLECAGEAGRLFLTR